jgi:GMP synthase (glutamine-hydrolysing) A subunit
LDKIGVLDFGGQYTQLIARRIRELGVYSEILPCTEPLDDVLAAGYKGLVLSGGPSSVYEDDAPLPDKRLFEAGIPLLGICYGMQIMGYLLGGHVVPAERREYGAALLTLTGTGGLLDGVKPERGNQVSVWMSHGDTVMKPPRGFVSLASTENCPVAAMADSERGFFAVQFHPEVAHTPQGKIVLENFVRRCGARGDWSMPSFVEDAIDAIRQKFGEVRPRRFRDHDGEAEGTHRQPGLAKRERHQPDFPFQPPVRDIQGGIDRLHQASRQTAGTVRHYGQHGIAGHDADPARRCLVGRKAPRADSVGERDEMPGGAAGQRRGGAVPRLAREPLHHGRQSRRQRRQPLGFLGRAPAKSLYEDMEFWRERMIPRILGRMRGRDCDLVRVFPCGSVAGVFVC